ncbi:MAG TPA: CRTAC1 family protein [Blastocatellia bacterium]|nr:CRTAC1 family protein [Blastocatellia bacterium]
MRSRPNRWRRPGCWPAVIQFLIVCGLAVLTGAQDHNSCGNRKLPQLVDVTSKTGIRFIHTSAPEKKYIVESMSGGVLMIDYDRDGWPDLYFTNAPTVEMALQGKKSRSALYRNNRNLTFVDVTEKAGVGDPGFAMGGAVGDYNNDGWPDLYVTCLGGNVLYRNNGDGTFTDVTKAAGVADGRWSTGASFGDYDGDGFLDLAVANYVDFKLHDLPAFGSSPTCKYRGIDVQCGPRGLKGAGDSIFRNNGDGTFTDVTAQTGWTDPDGFYGMQVAWSDLGNRGVLDGYVANDSTANFLYRNEGRKKFTEIGLESGTAVSGDGSEQGSMGIAIGDYLHNGRFAVFVTNFVDEYNTLYRNDGDYSFKDVSYEANVAQVSRPYVGWGTGFFDLDNDSWLDLLVVNGHVYPQIDTLPSGARYRQPKLLHLNLGNGTFCDASRMAGPALQEPRAARGAAFGDLDNDGQVDVVVSDLDGPAMILHNERGEGNHWVTLELGAAKGNRLAIGARVRAVTGNVTQIEEVRSGASYLSQNDLRLHFGIGKYTKVDFLEIRWPSGKVETIKDVAADKFYSILEGEGLVAFDRIRPTSRVGTERNPR